IAESFAELGFHFINGNVQASWHGFQAVFVTAVTLALTLGVISQTSTGWDQTTHNHVFFQTTQVVYLAGYRTFGQYAGSFLEGSRGDEGLGRQRRLGDTQQHTLAFGGDLAGTLQFLVF